MRALGTAVRTLSILPFPGKDAARMSDSLYFFPFVGGLLGVLVAGAGVAVVQWTGWAEMAAMVCVGLSIFLTRGLHKDGLADTADAMGAYTMEKRLAIMKDPRVGSFAVLALLVVTGFQWLAYSRLVMVEHAHWIVTAFLASRMAQVVWIVVLPYARAEGGMAKSFIDGASKRHLLLVLLATLCLGFLSGGWPAVLVVVVTLLACGLLSFWMKRNFNGVTGDLLGMGSEVVETAILSGAAIWVTVLAGHA